MFFLLHCTYLHKYRLELELTVWLLQALRCILDSPLNKAGMVGAIYVKIDQGGMFEVKPHVQLPQTCSRFCGVISTNFYNILSSIPNYYVVVCATSLCLMKLILVLYLSGLASKIFGAGQTYEWSSSSCCWGTYNASFACQLLHSSWVILF